jgi:hypothetical protein
LTCRVIRFVLRPKVPIIVPSLNESNLHRYLQEGPNLRIEPVRPSLFFVDVRKFVKESDLVLLRTFVHEQYPEWPG